MTEPLDTLPYGSDIFVDSNIFIYGLSGQSSQCARLLSRIAAEEVTGVTLFEVVSDATHRFMVAEAAEKKLIPRASANALQNRKDVILRLSEYWIRTERILRLKPLWIGIDEELMRQAQQERASFALMTADSLIVAAMRSYEVLNLASLDRDFERVSGLALYQPTDVALP